MITRSQIYGEADSIIAGSPTLFCDQYLQIISIETLPAAAYWSVGTRWCIARDPWFGGYRQAGPLLLLRSALRQRDYMLAPAHGEFRSRHNRRVSLSLFIDQHPSAYHPLRRLGIFWGAHADDRMQIWYASPRGAGQARLQP